MIEGLTYEYKGLRFVGYGEADFYGGAPCVLLPAGRRIYFPNLRHKDGEMVYDSNLGRGHTKRLYGGAALENISQALAQIVIRDNELRIARKSKFNFLAAGQVHDELIFVVKDALVPTFTKMVNHEMCQADEFFTGLPLACETDNAQDYGSCK